MQKRSILAAIAAVGVGVLPVISASNRKNAPDFHKQIPKEARIPQALNRLTFGPRPGDAEHVKAVGLKRWIDEQLHPYRIPENALLDAKLQPLDSLFMTTQTLVENYPEQDMVRRMLKTHQPFPSDPDKRMMLERLADRIERRKKSGDQRPPEEEMTALLTADQVHILRTGTPDQRLAAFEAIPAWEQNDVLLVLPQGIRQSMFAPASQPLRRKLDLANGPVQVVANDLLQAKLLRAVYSNRQLQEVLTDFWFNHFNVYLDKGADHFLVTAYERDAIRPHVLGKFRELLEATAKSPAMLFYLDNWESRANSAPKGRGKNAPSGLNENYGRELMELHTLGVDGGYTQHDVTEVARCFTGWTIDRPGEGGPFTFNAKMHDQGEKVVLGVKIPAGGGMEDGGKVLDILARHPSTARFISKKLAMRFVADDPPPELVEHMAQTFLKTGGDLRAVMNTMISSKEFWSVGAYRSKLKSPLEMVASAVRALNGEVDFASNLAGAVANMGEPLYRKQEPTGYSNSSREWLNSAGLLARMNFGLNLADNKVPGVKVAPQPAGQVFGDSPESPEFQRH